MMTVRNQFSFVALAACTLLSFSMPSSLRAQQDVGESSNYSPVRGETFFVLTDTQYGTSDEALLRVELSASSGRAALAQYGGIDIALYRVPDPLAFLKAQKNPHRVDVTARPHDEGVANTLSYLWSNAWNKSRRAWRDLFSGTARGSVTKTVPELKTHLAQPDYQPANTFKPLDGFDLVDRFRYPLMAAKPIDPLEKTQGVQLQGSSSNFLPKNEGNFYVPLGKLRPGLYIAEAMLGTRRAATLVFVSDTIAVTKLASGSLTVWTAHRADGRPVFGAKLQWTDGRGVLAQSVTDSNGLATLTHTGPERTYLLGQDAAGGVFVSENFYYDSEIHDTKLYTVTDRPLYRPGDEVRLKFLAREYHAANRSSPARAGGLDIVILDPNGSPVWSGDARFMSDRGGETMFRLPPDAPAGGYEIRVKYQSKTYGAAFRVAEYVKPHMEIAIAPDNANFKTGEPVSGTIRLTYPNGDPVKNAAIDLTLRAQVLTMVQGELRYGGLFPIEQATASLTTNDKGEAKFSLPPAKEPSRLIISVLATDGAAYRVRKTSELLIERAAANWKLVSARKFSMPGERMNFQLEPENSEKTAPPTQWEIIRLEGQEKTSGPFDAATLEWTPTFDKPGSYSLLLRDAQGRLVAAAAHWVGGRDGEAREIKALPGTIEMIPDKERYRAGETAEVLMTFSEPVDEALLTLERDRVEATALLSAAQGKKADWISAERLAPNQWRARVPITESYAPNMTLSLVYVKAGEYVFQNAGLVVETPRLTLDIKPGKAVAKPGETVEVDINVSLADKPAKAALTISVVDEMIYALQPEIAPDMVEFFQHVRRNNVRTSASLNFITYDEAANYANNAARQPPDRHQYNERNIKVLERARRDDTDTAAWVPTLLTDEKGHARFSFKVPDALSRWRITVRAVALGKESPKGAKAQQDIAYGQRAAWMQSDKSLYAKWTSPTWMREGDAPVASVAVFNNTGNTLDTEVALKLAGKEITQKAAIPHGVAWLSFKLPPFNGEQTARLEVRTAGKEGGNDLVDALETSLTAEPARWHGPNEQIVPLERGTASLQLPADARRLRLRLAASGSEHFLRIADSLLEYPWGCTEQTASRLIPLSIIMPLLSTNRAEGRAARLRQTLYSQRLRLAALAGPQAVFGWWGHGTDNSALMTAYAYYADWRATQALGMTLPASHWERVLVAYRDHAENEPILHQALALWFIQQIGLPVRTQTEGLLSALAKKDDESAHDTDEDSPLLNDPNSPLGIAYARVLASLIAQKADVASRINAKSLDNAGQHLQLSGLPSAYALLLLSGKDAKNRENAAATILADISEEMPTFDRALALVWTQQALGGKLAIQSGRPGFKPADEKWQETVAAPNALGDAPEWLWPAGNPLPETLRVHNAPAKLTAILQYEGTDHGKSALPVEIERRLYRLDRREFKEGIASYARLSVNPADGLSTQGLYLDEIRISSKQARRYGIVEVPIPPGASIERTTWGINLIEGETGEARPIDRGKAEEHRNRYGVPVDFLPANGSIVVRHLLRVGQSGRFTLPPVRYYGMYQPAMKAYAKEENKTWVVK